MTLTSFMNPGTYKQICGFKNPLYGSMTIGYVVVDDDGIHVRLFDGTAMFNPNHKVVFTMNSQTSKNQLIQLGFKETSG